MRRTPGYLCLFKHDAMPAGPRRRCRSQQPSAMVAMPYRGSSRLCRLTTRHIDGLSTPPRPRPPRCSIVSAGSAAGFVPATAVEYPDTCGIPAITVGGRAVLRRAERLYREGPRPRAGLHALRRPPAGPQVPRCAPFRAALTGPGLSGIVCFHTQDSPELVEARSPVRPRRLT